MRSGGRRDFVRLCVAGLLAYGSYAMCRTPLLPLFARDLGADAPMVGFVTGASTLTGIALKLPAGALSDVLGRRRLLIAGGLAFAFVPFTYMGIASLGALVALRFVHGSATAIFGPVASASLSDIAPPGRRATWLSTYSTVQGAGQALGSVIAGYLLASGRYDLVFLVAGTIAVGAPLIVAGWPATHHPAIASDRLERFRRGIAEVVREPLILMTSLAQAAQFVLNGMLNAFLPLYGRDVVGLSIPQLGWLFALQTATTLAARPIMGVLSDRISRRGLIAAGLALSSSAVFLISEVRGLPALIVAVFVYAIGVAVTTAATSAYVTDLAGPAQYGAAHGVFGTIYDIGDALGPIVAGLLVASVGFAHMFQFMAGVVLLVALAFLWATTLRPQPLRV